MSIKDNTKTFQKLYHEVKAEMIRQGINPKWASIMTGHGMIESSWGQSANAKINNYWGMKGSAEQKGHTLSTTEGYGSNAQRIHDKFLSFNNLQNGVRATVKRLNEKFGAFYGEPSDSQYVKNLNSKSTYFTGDPVLFYKNLHSIVNGETAKEAIKLDEAQQTLLDLQQPTQLKHIEYPDATSVFKAPIINNISHANNENLSTYDGGWLPEVTATAPRLHKNGGIIPTALQNCGYKINPEITAHNTNNRLPTTLWSTVQGKYGIEDVKEKNEAYRKLKKIYQSWLKAEK